MNIIRKTLVAAAAAICALGAGAANPVAKHVVFIGLDGWAANTYNQSDMPVVKGLAQNGSMSLAKRSVLPSASAINWASIFMGVPTEIHGYLTWGSQTPDMQQPEGVVKEHGIMPTIFQTTRRQHPQANLALFAEWDGIKHLVDTLALNHFEQPAFDYITTRACDYIIAHKPELIAIVYDHPDHPGHDTGWGSPEYFEMMTTLDSEIARIVKAVEKAGMLDETVFVLTGDHGGKGTAHGGPSMEEMNAPLIISGKGIKSGHKISEVVMSPDITPIIAAILGVEPEPVWRGKVPESIFK